jgi:hypothetical protein
MAQKKGNIEGADVNLPPNLSYTFFDKVPLADLKVCNLFLNTLLSI